MDILTSGNFSKSSVLYMHRHIVCQTQQVGESEATFGRRPGRRGTWSTRYCSVKDKRVGFPREVEVCRLILMFNSYRAKKYMNI